MNLSERFAGVVDIIIGLLYVGSAVPLILKRVAMNDVYGIRVSKAFTSEANWYAINTVGGWWFAAAGLVVLLVGLVALRRPPRTSAGLLLCVVGPTAGALLVIIPIVLYAATLK